MIDTLTGGFLCAPQNVKMQSVMSYVKANMWKNIACGHYIGSVYTVIKWQQPINQSIKEKEKITHCSTPNHFSFNKNLCIFQSALYFIYSITLFTMFYLKSTVCICICSLVFICSIASHLFLRSDCLRVLSKQDHFFTRFTAKYSWKNQHKIITNEELYDRGS